VDPLLWIYNSKEAIVYMFWWGGGPNAASVPILLRTVSTYAFLHTFLLDYAIFMPPDRRQRASRSPQPPQQTPQVFAAALRAKADRSVTAQSAVDDSVIDNATTIDDLPRITIKGKKYVKRERLNQKRGTYSWVHNHGQLLVEIPREIDSEII
jgi:hypothetical protein